MLRKGFKKKNEVWKYDDICRLFITVYHSDSISKHLKLNTSKKITSWKINGWNLQPSPMKRKEHDLKQPSMIMFQPLIFQRCKPLEFAQRILILKHEKTGESTDLSSLHISTAPRHTPATCANPGETTQNEAKQKSPKSVRFSVGLQGLKIKYHEKIKGKMKIYTHTYRCHGVKHEASHSHIIFFPNVSLFYFR